MSGVSNEGAAKGNHTVEKAGIRFLSVVNHVLIVFIWSMASLFFAAVLSDMFIFKGYFLNWTINLFLVKIIVNDLANIFNILDFQQITYFGGIFVAGVLIAEIIVKLLLDGIIKIFVKNGSIKSITINIINLIVNCVIVVQTVILFTTIILIIYFANIYKEANNNEETGFSRQTAARIGAYLLDKQLTSAVMLKHIISEIENKEIDVDKLNDDEYRKLALNICKLFERKGNVDTGEEHFLRNYFSRAPETLSGMIDKIQNDNKIFLWKLLAPDYAMLHMYGKDGEYNVKFISEDGHFEAVYNTDGVLLTQYNDQLNMGTFNYADQVLDKEKHSVLDVVPYIRWGNTAGSVSILESEPSDFDENPDAVKQYSAIYERIYGKQYAD
jgi:hypothetical protein